MLKRVCGIVIALGLVFAAGAAIAQQGPSGRWWRSSQVVNELNLSRGEIKRLEKAYSASRRNIIKQKGRVEAEQFELQTMVENRNANAAAIKAQHRKLEKARSDLASSKFNFVVEARKIIGVDRFQRLLRIHDGGRAKSKKRRR